MLNRRIPALTLVALFAAGTFPSMARASDFVDTRVTLLFADDNVLADAGETTPNSPSARFGAANSGNNQFYDNFNTKYSGFESLTNLVLYKQAPAYFEGLTTEAALARTLLVARERPTAVLQSVVISDASSWIRLNYTPKSWNAKKGEGVSFTGFPLSADRFRLGYAYKISWGGSRICPSAGESVPGAKLQLTKSIGEDKIAYGFVGAKSTLILNDRINEQETNYGFLAGAGVDITKFLRWEANGGYFQKGVNPDTSVLGLPVTSRGVSSQLVLHIGQPVSGSIDFILYKNDPEMPQRFFRPEQYPGGFSMQAALEGSYLEQTLADPDIFGQTTKQRAYAGALTAQAKYDYTRLSFLGLWRSLSYIQFNVPGFPPFQDFPDGTAVTDERFFALGLDHYLPKLHLTPGIIGGVQLPATLSTTGLGGNNPAPSLTGRRTVVVRDENLLTVLPSDTSAVPIYSIKGTARWDLSEFMSTVGQVFVNYDENRTTFRDSVEGVAEPTREKPLIVGFNLILQARF